MAEDRVWIERAVILALHDRLLAAHGGLAGIRDEALLDPALARPRHLAAYTASRISVRSPPPVRLSSSSSEYFLVSSFAIFAYLPRADDSAAVSAPRVGDEVIFLIDMAQCTEPLLTVIFARILGFYNRVSEYLGGAADDASLQSALHFMVVVSAG